MIVVGLTGSIAMGKSAVAEIFRSNGIPVFEADAEVHKLYDSAEGAALLAPLVPEAVVNDRFDRNSLSAIVLRDQDLLNRLEAVVHREIGKRRDSFVADARRRGEKMVVLDIPLLFEKNLDTSCDVTVTVSAPAHLQRERALARPGMTPKKLSMILQRQMPDAEKRRRADHVLENDSTLADLREKVVQLIGKLQHA